MAPAGAPEPVVAIGELLRRSYTAFGDRIAVRDRRRELSYQELHRRAIRLATGLLGLGTRPGDRVAVLAPNRVEWVEVDHACYLAGLARVAPLTRLHPRELAQIVADADPAVVIVEGDWFARTGRDWLPSGVRLVAIGEPADADAMSFEDLVASGTDQQPEPPQSDALSWLMYTSGSTGLPKGVMHTQRALGAMLRNNLAELPTLRESAVAVHTAPLSHFSGVIALAVFAVGGTNVLYESFDADRLVASLGAGEVSILPVVPTQITMLLEELNRRSAAGAPVDVRSVERVVYAGSAIAPDRLASARETFGDVLLQFYGSTEAPMPLTALHPEHHVAGVADERRLASAGLPTRFVELEIVDDDGARLPPGQTGEVVTRGEQVMVGYWRQAEATAQVLGPDGWLRTGDLGYLDDEGFLSIVDRKKDMIVTGGFNVYPREVENVLSALPGVREVAVTGGPSATWGEEIVAVVALQSGDDVSAASVIKHCRANLADYKAPKRVEFVDELPKSGTGKIMKQEIRERLWASHDRRV